MKHARGEGECLDVHSTVPSLVKSLAPQKGTYSINYVVLFTLETNPSPSPSPAVLQIAFINNSSRKVRKERRTLIDHMDIKMNRLWPPLHPLGKMLISSAQLIPCPVSSVQYPLSFACSFELTWSLSVDISLSGCPMVSPNV